MSGATHRRLARTNIHAGRSARHASMRSRRAFTLIEVTVALLILAALALVLVETLRGTLRGFVSREEATGLSTDLTVILTQLRIDVGAAEGRALPDLTSSPDTGADYPKLFAHLAVRPDSPTVQLYTLSMALQPVPIPSDDPISPALASPHPLTPVAIAAGGRCQSALAWVPRTSEQDTSAFVVNVREGGMRATQTYAYNSKTRSLERRGPDGVTVLARGTVASFAAWPVLEFIVPNQNTQPMEFSKCWVELRLSLQPLARESGPPQRPIDLATRIVPRYLNALAHSKIPL